MGHAALLVGSGVPATSVLYGGGGTGLGPSPVLLEGGQGFRGMELGNKWLFYS
jgi:hypothetical protein